MQGEGPGVGERDPPTHLDLRPAHLQRRHDVVGHEPRAGAGRAARAPPGSRATTASSRAESTASSEASGRSSTRRSTAAIAHRPSGSATAVAASRVGDVDAGDDDHPVGADVDAGLGVALLAR